MPFPWPKLDNFETPTLTKGEIIEIIMAYYSDDISRTRMQTKAALEEIATELDVLIESLDT